MLVIRADASTAIGTGHVMRTLALAQAWLDKGGKVVFASAELPDALQRRLTAEGLLTHQLDVEPGSDRDADETLAIAGKYQAQWVVVDGYRLTASYRDTLAGSGLNVLRVDDFEDTGRPDTTLLLNQNLGAVADLYPNWHDPERLLLGPRYALIRRELLVAVPKPRSHAQTAPRILVTLGGSDPDNQTLKVVRALQTVPAKDLEAAILVGAGNPHTESLRQAVADDRRLRLHYDVQNMGDLLSWADMAISAAGGSAWERALFGLPSLTMILADNQIRVAAALDRHGWSTNLGWFHQITVPQLTDAVCSFMNDKPRREGQSRRSQQAVDGHGAARTVDAMDRWCRGQD